MGASLTCSSKVPQGNRAHVRQANITIASTRGGGPSRAPPGSIGLFARLYDRDLCLSNLFNIDHFAKNLLPFGALRKWLRARLQYPQARLIDKRPFTPAMCERYSAPR
jgi:hypothetical protein